jgi:c-di-GMP-binding flagellar brake protein YcgR
LKEIEEKKTQIKLPFKSSPQAVRAVHDGDQCRTHFIANGRNLVKMRKKKLSIANLMQLIFMTEQK